MTMRTVDRDGLVAEVYPVEGHLYSDHGDVNVVIQTPDGFVLLDERRPMRNCSSGETPTDVALELAHGAFITGRAIVERIKQIGPCECGSMDILIDDDLAECQNCGTQAHGEARLAA